MIPPVQTHIPSLPPVPPTATRPHAPGSLRARAKMSLQIFNLCHRPHPPSRSCPSVILKRRPCYSSKICHSSQCFQTRSEFPTATFMTFPLKSPSAACCDPTYALRHSGPLSLSLPHTCLSPIPPECHSLSENSFGQSSELSEPSLNLNQHSVPPCAIHPFHFVSLLSCLPACLFE